MPRRHLVFIDVISTSSACATADAEALYAALAQAIGRTGKPKR
jgi:hypothetical protein